MFCKHTPRPAVYVKAMLAARAGGGAGMSWPIRCNHCGEDLPRGSRGKSCQHIEGVCDICFVKIHENQNFPVCDPVKTLELFLHEAAQAGVIHA